MTYFRKGDIVSANGVVLYDFDGEGTVTVVFGGRTHSPDYLNPGDLTLVTPLFKVGDEVRRDDGQTKGVSAKIIAIHGDYVWTEEAFPRAFSQPQYFVWRASDVTRVDLYRETAKYEQPPSAPLDAETVKSLRRGPLADILDERKARDEAETPPAINPGEF